MQDGHLHEIQKAVHEEVKIFKRREDFLGLFKVKYCPQKIKKLSPQSDLEKVFNVANILNLFFQYSSKVHKNNEKSALCNIIRHYVRKCNNKVLYFCYMIVYYFIIILQSNDSPIKYIYFVAKANSVLQDPMQDRPFSIY